MARGSIPPFFRQTDIFRFSATQRRAALVVCMAGFALMLFLYIRSNQMATNAQADSFEAAALEGLKAGTQANKGQYGENRNAEEKTYQSNSTYAAPTSTSHLQPHKFDPNLASFEELTEMGLSEKAARNMINYREKGGRFNKPEDLLKLYSLKKSDAEALMPFVWIEAEATKALDKENAVLAGKTYEKHYSATSKSTPLIIDINRADSITLLALPGIGAKRASSILKFRNKLGGFVSVDQVAETWGLPDSVFTGIKSSIICNPEDVLQLKLNTATEDELKAHPYIGWQHAKIIVAYRNQHGPFYQVDDLKKIHIVKNDWLEKVKPYFTTEQ